MNSSAGACRLLLQFLRTQESDDPYAFRFEPQNYILPTAGGESPSAHFDWTPDVLADLQAVRLPGRDPAVVQRVGERLRRFVKDAGWAQHERDIAQASAERRPIFLTIRSSAAELYALPWELLTLKSGQFIGEVDGLLLRFEWPESKSAPEQPKPRPEGGRILLAWSAAGGAVPATEHSQSIAAACAAGFHPFNSSTDVLDHASLARIVKTLEEAQQGGPPIAVLHLLCHGSAAGSTFGLCLDGENGPVVVDTAQLRQQLAPFASMVRLVVLSACDSGNAGRLGNQLGSAAQALHRCGFQSVIASRFPLSLVGSIALTESFYAELLFGPASLETAFLCARKRLARSETDLPPEHRLLDWASVQLYARHEDGDDTRPVVFRPFRGLLAFQPEHRRFFFGRSKEVQEILTVLQSLIDHKQERFLVVAGASGTGKSSVVFAGAVPKLLEANPELGFLRMRPGSDPERALNEALARRPSGTSALLVVDQFEEVFTQTEAPAARDAFVRRLWSLASAPEPGLRVIITLRVDFIGRCGELVLNADGLRLDRIAYGEAYRVFVAQLEPEQLRAAIVEPASKVGLELQAGLADRMLHEVGNEPGALPLLEDALDVLWQHRDERTLTQTTYDELGGVVGALKRRADTIVGKLAKEDLAIAQRLLVNLVAVADDSALDTRLRVALADLRNAFSMALSAGFERVLKDMVSARLLVQDGDGHMSRVEVAHEALIRKWPQLRTWLAEDRAGLLIQRRVRQAAQQWAVQNYDESLLYRGSQLAQASEWSKSWESRLGDLEHRFLVASDAQRVRLENQETARQRREIEAEERFAEEKRQKETLKWEAAQALVRRTRIAAIVLGLSFVGAAVAGVLAYRNSVLANQKSIEATEKSIEAKQKSDEARDGLLIAVAQARKNDPTAAATILREAGHQQSTLWTQGASDALQTGIAETVLRGHEAGVSSVAFSPDGKKIATGSSDKTARIWNADGTDSPIALKGHESDVSAVVFSPDGRMIATGSFDKTSRIWNADGSGSPVVLKGHEASIASVAFSPDGKRIVTGSQDQTVRIWNTDGSGSPIVFEGHEAPISSVAFSPDGKRIVSGSWDKTARIWNPDGSGSPVVLKGHEATISSVAFSPDGQRIVTGSSDKTISIWNADGSGSPIVLKGHEAAVSSVAFSPDGRRIAAGSQDQTARIWNADGSGSPIVLNGHGAAISSVAFSPDGKRIATGSRDQTARIWNADGSGSPVVLKAHVSYIYSVAFSPDGRKIVIGAQDQTARIWNADGSGSPIVLKGHQSYVYSVAFSPDGTRVVTGSGDKTARIWNADGSGSPVVLKGHQSPVSSVAFSPDGKRIVTGSGDKTARIWNADGFVAPVMLMGHGDDVTSVAFSPDGTKVVTGAQDQTARIWNADGSGSPVVLKGHEAPVHFVAFSPDGTKIATGSGDKTARIWNVDGSGSPVVFRGHENSVSSVAFSPDGTKIVTGSGDKTARIWNADGLGAPVVLRGHESAVSSVAFSADGKKIVTGSWDKSVRVWIVASDALLAALWNATTDCLPIDDRHELLLESPARAKHGYERCRQEVLKHRRWTSPPVP